MSIDSCDSSPVPVRIHGSTVIDPLQSTFCSSARVVFVDRFGIRRGVIRGNMKKRIEGSYRRNRRLRCFFKTQIQVGGEGRILLLICLCDAEQEMFTETHSMI